MLARRDTSLSVRPGSRVALEQHVREVSPLGALADQFDLGRALDRQLVLHEAGDLLRRSADELGQGRAAIAEHPRIPVLVCPERLAHTHLLEQSPKRLHGMGLRRVLGVVGNVVDARVRLRVLALEARHEHSSLSLRVENEGDRPLRRREGEACVVEDVVGVEEHGAGEASVDQLLRQPGQALLVLGLLDCQRHAARSFSRQSGSSSRNRRTRSPTGGCVTNSAARPSSRNGLIVYRGSVAGLP